MNANYDEFLKQLRDAEMVLIGIGEEFDNLKSLKQSEEYVSSRKILEERNEDWLIPALNMAENKQNDVYTVLNKFTELITEKNYFVVSVSTNDTIYNVNWREGRIVMPCGSSKKKQCVQNCGFDITDVTEEDRVAIKKYLSNLSKEESGIDEKIELGSCPICGEALVLNSIYTGKYDEKGYLDQWQKYTKWLQGTLNRKLLVVELGVGMQCPSVIRWPFEKIAFFNQKASFWRVNEKLYQLSEELNGKGTSISMNAIDWLRFMC